MAEEELAAFRDSWKEELTSKNDEERLVCAPSSDVPSQSGQGDLRKRYFEDSKYLNTADSTSKLTERECTDDASDTEDQPEYVSIARSLLDGRTSPLLDRIQEERTRRKRQYQNTTNACSKSLQQKQKQQQQPQRKVKKEEELLDQLIQDLV